MKTKMLFIFIFLLAFRFPLTLQSMILIFRCHAHLNRELTPKTSFDLFWGNYIRKVSVLDEMWVWAAEQGQKYLCLQDFYIVNVALVPFDILYFKPIWFGNIFIECKDLAGLRFRRCMLDWWGTYCKIKETVPAISFLRSSQQRILWFRFFDIVINPIIFSQFILLYYLGFLAFIWNEYCRSAPVKDYGI